MEQIEENLIIKIAKVETKVDFIIGEIQKLQDGTYSKIEMLMREKADRKDLDAVQKKLDDNIEKRMRMVEECVIPPAEHKELLKSTNTNGIYLIIGIVLIGILVGIMSYHILGIKLP